MRKIPLLLLILLALSPMATTLAASVSTNKGQYYKGDSVSISVSGFTGSVAVEVRSPSNKAVFVGEGSCSFRLKSDAELGTYRVSARSSGESASCTFKVIEKYVPPPPTPPPTPPVVEKKASSISIRSSSYAINLGDNLTISGTLNPKLGGERITLRLWSPAGRVDLEVRTSDGEYAYTFTPEVPGLWEAETSWAGNSEYKSCASSKIRISVTAIVNLSLLVAPRVLGTGETVILYVSTSPAMGGRLVVISLSRSGWLALETKTTTEGGWAVFLYTPTEVGAYNFKATWEGDDVYAPAESGTVNITVIEALTPEGILEALEEVERLTLALRESEGNLAMCRELSASLQSQVQALNQSLIQVTSELSDAQARIGELESELSDAQSKLLIYPAITFLMGFVPFLLFWFFKRREER